ncbi:MAG: ATP-binding cassette domain-containing protein [Legionellales bacterium]|nr:ATP-binding cassette domain-containing protein [Legionellales bacterium]
MIELINVSKTYFSRKRAIQALDQINLTIQANEIFGIIGQSGAGKSTLLRCMNLLDRPTNGQVIVNDQDLTQLSPLQLRQARHRIGMIFQHFNLLHSQTVYQNVALPLKLLGQDKTTIARKVQAMLEVVGLADYQHRYPAQLSGGQKQRIAIARTLAGDPSVLLCDEATSALDPRTTLDILELLRRINQQLQLTIVLITHEMDVMKTICDRVAILDQGHIIEQADVVTLFSQPQTELGQLLTHACLQHELPVSLSQRIKPTPQSSTAYPLLQLYFVGESATKPIMAQLIQQTKLPINIVQANMEYIKQQPIGVMTIEVRAQPVELENIIRYFNEQGLTVELIGYVH